MGLSVEMMRARIATCYPGIRWKNRCKAMNVNQVIAIYHKFLNDGKFKRTKEQKKKEKEYYQLTLWDIGMEMPSAQVH